MNDLQLIKEEIYNCGLVAPLLESMGCTINDSTSSSERIEASRPDGNNRRSVQVYLNEHLSGRVRSKAHIPIQDIYDLVSYIEFGKETSEEFKRNIPKSKKYIVETLKLDQFKTSSTKKLNDPNAWLKKIQKQRSKRINLRDIESNIILPESLLDGFIMQPHITWINDGIPIDIQEKFEVGFDIASERIVFPIRNSDGLIVGIKGRSTKPSDEEDYKYISLYPFSKTKEIYNLHRALPFIINKNEVLVPEAEKSVMKLYAMGYEHSVSQMGSELSRIQAEILKRISPNIKIILVYDKDKSTKEIKQFAKVFDGYENLYAIVDIKDMISLKESPADANKEIWEELYNNHCYKIFP